MATARPARRERRKGRRTRLFGFSALSLTAGVQVVVRDVGAESFAVESPLPFEVGSQHEFQFSSYGLTTTVNGIVKRCEMFMVNRYVVGFAAVYRTAADRSVVAGCVDVLGSVSAVRSQR